MSIQTVNPNTNKNVESLEEITDKKVDAVAVSDLAVSQLSNQQNKNPVSSQDISNDQFEDSEDQEVETTFQRRPQFRFNENNRRK